MKEIKSNLEDSISVNPDILRWAREKSGYSIEDVAAVLKKESSIIDSWENGKKAPTYLQLEKLAYHLYKRPIALFFLPEPPDETEPSKAFRTIPEQDLKAFDSDTRFAIRQAKAMQLILYELSEDLKVSSRRIFDDIHLDEKTKVSNAANQVREYLDVSLEKQRTWKDNRTALNNWRDLIQDAGVFVFKRSFKQRNISGFSLLDKKFPVIYLNNSTPQTRQIFSLIHELAHVLLKENGMTKQDDSYIELLLGRFRKVEIFCNLFASEFLVPTQDFSGYVHSDFQNESVLRDLANRYKVSREVILRKALEFGLVSASHYQQKAREWTKQAQETLRQSKGGNYYATQSAYMGSRFINLAFGHYYRGRCTREELADYLNVKVQSLPHFEPLTIGGSSL